MIKVHEVAGQLQSLRSVVFITVLSGCFFIGSCRSKPTLEFGKGLDVPYVQTSPAVVQRMLEMAHVRKDDVVVDLGCGDGRIAIAAATEFGARGIGYDIDPDRIAEARRNAKSAGVEARTSFVQQDFFKAPIARASVVTLFMLPTVMERIEPRLRSDLAPGTRIVSHSFGMRDWPPEEVVHIEGRTLYRWTVPEREPLRVR
jgi:SAM-dependent methyltransferase